MAVLPDYKEISRPWVCGHLGKKTRRTHKLTLVLDLDETLIHANMDDENPYDFKVSINDKGRVFDIYIDMRPFVKEFIAEVSKHFEVVIFTAAEVLLLLILRKTTLIR